MNNQNKKCKRNIYTLLYDQIKSDVTGINKELAVAKKLIMPYHLLQRNRMRKEVLLLQNVKGIPDIEFGISKMKKLPKAWFIALIWKV